MLKNATGLRSALTEVVSISTQDGLGIQDQMISITQLLDKIANLGNAYQSLYERISSVRIELSDIISETF